MKIPEFGQKITRYLIDLLCPQENNDNNVGCKISGEFVDAFFEFFVSFFASVFLA